jgi:light-regulated signal transduction histidine kinase (bacteriophytochrome)
MVCVLFTDVTERKKAERALQESNQELTEYSYALTHSLKEPFRAISNYAAFLSEDLKDTVRGEPQAYLAGLKDAVRLSNKNFEDLETLYRIKNHPMNIEPFNMRGLLDELQSLLSDAPDRQLKVAPRWPVFRSERFLLRQAFFHLISNGFKYNRSEIKRVEVGLQKVDENRFEIFVRDNGIGIDPQYHGQIFDIFQRLHAEREYDGSGIGLAVVRRAVHRIGGKVKVESDVGKGSTFYINLPNAILEDASNP